MAGRRGGKQQRPGESSSVKRGQEQDSHVVFLPVVTSQFGQIKSAKGEYRAHLVVSSEYRGQGGRMDRVEGGSPTLRSRSSSRPTQSQWNLSVRHAASVLRSLVARPNGRRARPVVASTVTRNHGPHRVVWLAAGAEDGRNNNGLLLLLLSGCSL